MFSSFGWFEFFLILIIGLIVIGPERLPAVIEDVRAAIYAARKGIANAKRELNGELEEFEEFRKPLDTVSKYAAMGPARAVSSLLFDGDEEYLESFDPRRALADEDQPTPSGPRPAPARNKRASAPAPAPEEPKRAGFNWEDVL
ncbi:Sec-independent protein translocase protein TatB [Corynebacterium sp. TA-R-1]|uniref:Sec-independent protein translocase protein TatB n=1 Tax=Corynebacterium stercoris TaxID=2943490 RepID=A0ABT1G119_9CORY|nr:Sec-independent protein translocase protein TatB [Corynebacterium stercoris]